MSHVDATRRWQLANPDKVREYKRRWRLANLDVAREMLRRWHAAHPERKREALRRWRLAHRDEILAKRRAAYAAAAPLARERSRLWQRAHPEQRAHVEATRRARKTGNGGSHSFQEWTDKVQLLGAVCFYCGEPRPLTRDHKLPLSRGGRDDIANILPACRSCNAKKGRLTTTEYLRRPHAIVA